MQSKEGVLKIKIINGANEFTDIDFNPQCAKTAKTNKLQGQKQFEKSSSKKQLTTLRNQDGNVRSKLFEP